MLGQLLNELADLVAGKLQERVGVPPAAAPPILLDRTRLAEALGCSLPTVDKLTRAGLPHVRVGDSPRYEIEQVLEHLRAKGAVRGD